MRGLLGRAPLRLIQIERCIDVELLRNQQLRAKLPAGSWAALFRTECIVLPGASAIRQPPCPVTSGPGWAQPRGSKIAYFTMLTIRHGGMRADGE